jgi:hypothetical protein
VKPANPSRRTPKFIKFSQGSSSATPKKDPNEIDCWTCGLKGHYSSNCPSNTKSERDDEERNSEEETLPLDNFFLSPNQNLESTTDWYRDVGKNYVKDIDGNVNVRLAYAYDTPPSCVGKENQSFFLMSMTTLVTKKVDILHHAQASLEGKPLLPKRSIQASDCLRSFRRSPT